MVTVRELTLLCRHKKSENLKVKPNFEAEAAENSVGERGEARVHVRSCECAAGQLVLGLHDRESLAAGLPATLAPRTLTIFFQFIGFHERLWVEAHVVHCLSCTSWVFHSLLKPPQRRVVLLLMWEEGN